MNELDILYPEPASATVGGITADLYPVKLRNAKQYAEIVGNLALLLSEPSEVACAAFCAKHEQSMRRLLLDQTSLTADQLDSLTGNDAAMWLNYLMLSNAQDFSRALFGTAVSQSDGAKSTRD